MKEKKAYQAKYIDDIEENDIVIFNDGEQLSVKIRDVLFSGPSFDMLKPSGIYSWYLIENFTLDKYKYLSNCCLKCNLPINLIMGNSKILANLFMKLKIGSPSPLYGIAEKVRLVLSLSYDDKKIISSGMSGSFGVELIDLKKQLPEDHYILCCFNCMYSDYATYGTRLFGSLLCFRENMQASMRAKDIEKFYQEMETKMELVQETSICPDFLKRDPETGYRTWIYFTFGRH